MSTSPAPTRPLTVSRATALYIGALLGPGLLLLPGLAAEQAGPASIIAWVALLGLSAILAAVFTGLGQAVPGAAGAAGYAAAGLGRRAAAMTRWWFLAGVIAGAPIVCLIGASYVTALTGGGPLLRAAVAAGLLLAVLGLAAGGVRASAVAQLLLVGLLIAVVVTAVAGAAHAARPANWTPFAPHGWLSIGRAASTLMLSFVGWEAVAPLTGRLRAGQLSRVIGIAFTVTAVLYLGLAVATVSVLGRGSDLNVPLADLLQLAIGPGGRAVAAVAALVLTAGAVNAYLSGAAEMLRELTAAPSQNRPNGAGRLPRPSVSVFLGFIALAGLALIALSALRLADITVLVSVPTTMFLCVYLSCTVSAARLLTGKTRAAAAVAALAVIAILAFSGWTALLAAVVVAVVAGGHDQKPVTPFVQQLAEILKTGALQPGADMPGQDAQTGAARRAPQQSGADATAGNSATSAPPTSPIPSSRRALVRATGQAAHFDELEAEPQDAVKRAIQGRLVQVADQDSVGTVGFDPEVTECLTADLPQTTRDGDPVAVRAHVPSTWT